MARWHSRQSMTLPITAAFSVVSLKIERAVPRDNPPHPPTSPRGKKKDLTPQAKDYGVC